MLFSPYLAAYGALYDNIGATITDTGIGTTVTAGATANTKGSESAIFGAPSVINRDCYGIAIILTGGGTTNTQVRHLVDIMIDHAGGSAWSVLIPNLLANAPALKQGGVKYFFPIKIPAGSTLAARSQSTVASKTVQVSVVLYGESTRNEQTRIGSYVETFGVDEVNTSGTAIVPGTNAWGSWASLGTSTRNLWWWQCSGIVNLDQSLKKMGYLTDVAAGDATYKKTLIEMLPSYNDDGETTGKEAFGLKVPIRVVPAGVEIWARSAGEQAPDSSPRVAAYGLGG